METNDRQERAETPAEALTKSGICGVEGILEADLCPVTHQLHITFDPSRISDREVAKRLERMEPYLKQRFERCLFQIGSKACEACAVRLEKRAEAIPGVRRASASFIGGVMSVQFDEAQVREQEVLDRLLNEGVKVAPWRMPEAPGGAARWWSSLLASPVEVLLTVATLVFLVIGAVAPGVGWPPAVATAAFVVAYVAGGWFGVQSAWASLREGTVDIDLLMILAALGAAVIGAPLEGGTLLFLFALSNVLQQAAMDRARKAIHALMALRPTEALVRRDGVLVTLGIDALVVGDLVLVRPGERVPLDGEIVQGESALDEASLTGESMPVTKRPGDPVFAGTINTSGGLEVRVTRLARDSAIARLIQMVEHAQSEKAETQRFLDKAEQVYAAGVILFVLGLIVVPWVVGDQPFREVFYRAMTVMVVASPCALVISTPASILSAIGGAARQGVLFKGGLHLERAAAIKVVALDKTGTLTTGKPAVRDILADDVNELLALAAAVEVRSEHPLAKAIVAHAHAKGVAFEPCAGFQSLAGQGVRGRVGTGWVHVGDPRMFAREQVDGLAERLGEVERLQGQGKSCIVVTVQGEREARARVAGIIALADVIRPDAAAVVAGLKRIGIKRVVMLTGDHRRVAEAIGREAGVDEVHAELMPEDKWRIVQSLKAAGPVAMVGDGVNDAPALASADIGIAMGAAGTDVAMETADIVLMGERLRPIVYALAISKAARRVVAQNLVFSLAVIVVLVVAALGYALPLPVGVVGHEGSTVLVCLNGLRLLRFRAPH
jgi:Cd2+/Zn2+-exporting ATPase